MSLSGDVSCIGATFDSVPEKAQCEHGTEYASHLYTGTQDENINKALRIWDVTWLRHTIGDENASHALYDIPTINPSSSLSNALNHKDIKGCQYVSSRHFNTTCISLLYNTSDTVVEKFANAIHLGHTEGVEFLIKDVGLYNLTINERESLLRGAYQGQKLDIATIFIRSGVSWDGMSMFVPNPMNVSLYLSHLDQIQANLSVSENMYSQSIVNLMFQNSSKPLCSTPDVCQILDKSIVSNTPRTPLAHGISCYAFINTHQSIEDVVLISSLSHLHECKLKIYLSNMTIMSDYFMGFRPEHPCQSNFVMVSFQPPLRDAVVLHELGHFTISVVFQNNAFPYRQPFFSGPWSQKAKYQRAVISTVQNIGTHLLNTSLCSTSISYYFRPDSTPCLLELKRNLKLVIAEWYAVAHGLGYTTSPYYLNLLETEIFSKLNASSIPVSRRGALLDAHVARYGWNNDAIFLLHRIRDLAVRGTFEQDKEFLPRLPELYTKGVNPELLHKILGPLEAYWKSEITPVVEDMYKDSSHKHCIRNTGRVDSDSFWSISWFPFTVMLVAASAAYAVSKRLRFFK